MKATFCYSFSPWLTEKGSVIPIFYSCPSKPRLGNTEACSSDAGDLEFKSRHLMK